MPGKHLQTVTQDKVVHDELVSTGRPGTNDAAADPEKKRRAVVPAGWGRVPGHEIAFNDRLPYLLTTEV